MARGIVIAIVGAESTGKTTLAQALACALRDAGRDDVVVVGEVLREFCERHARTPRQHEQAGIAAAQTQSIEAAARAHEIVVADTTALMIAIYSDLVFGDHSLYPEALRAHAACDATLLTAIDLPWVADGLQRDGAHVREPVDALLRAALAQHSIDHAVVGGQGPSRTVAALNALRGLLGLPATAQPAPRWRGLCERCGDPDCERHLLPRA